MRATLNGIGVEFQLEGRESAPAVVLIHGFPFDQQLWAAQVAALKKDFRVLTYDLRGMGKSALGPAPQPLEAYVDDLLALMDRAGLVKAALLGLSMGGYIALRALQRAPERFWALALCDTRADADGDEGKLKRAAGIKAIREKGTEAFVKGMLPALLSRRQGAAERTLLKMMLANRADGMANALSAMAGRTDSTAFLGKIRIPVLVLAGANDSLIPPAVSEAMAKKIPKALFKKIPGAGHVSNLEAPAAFNRLVLDFLGDCLV